MTSIGFFGDSLCSVVENDHSIQHNYNTYLKQVSNHYKANIIHTGIAESSIWDVYLLQLKPLITANKIPDISIFSWGAFGRLYHRQVRSLHRNSVARINYDNDLENKHIWLSAKMFYENLFDQEKEMIEWVSVLEHLDRHIFSQWPVNKKLIHIWSFALYHHPPEAKYDINAVKYPFRWQHGVEIRPPLMWLSSEESWPTIGKPNHISGHENNKIVADTIIQSIDNYKSGELYHMDKQ